MLVLNNNDKVIVEPGSMGIPEIRALYSADKQNKGKPFFNAVITYAYYMYRQAGPYAHFPFGMRDNQVTSRHLDGISSEKFYKSNKAKAFILFYKNSQMSILQRSIEDLEKDIEETVKHIGEIPRQKQIMVEVEIEIPKAADSSEMIPWKTKQPMMIDNSKEKLESYATVEKLFANLDRLKKREKEQSLKSKKEVSGRAIFDLTK